MIIMYLNFNNTFASCFILLIITGVIVFPYLFSKSFTDAINNETGNFVVLLIAGNIFHINFGPPDASGFSRLTSKSLVS
jgi:hypothetical protein